MAGPALELLVGTYTERLPHVEGRGDGILGLTVSPDGVIGAARTLAPLRNPSWVTVARGGELVVAVVESDDFDGTPTGGLASFHRDPRTGELAPLGARPSGGATPAFVTVDATGTFAIVANYGGGSVAAVPIDADGRLGEPTSVVAHTGSGPVADRQDGPHAHQVLFDPLEQEVLAVDLGIDAIVRYRLGTDGRLERVGAVVVPRGTGPRHAAFSLGGQRLFVVGELSGTLLEYRRGLDGWSLHGELRLGSGDRAVQPAAVRVHPQSGLLLVSLRLADEVLVLDVSDEPTVRSRFAAGGRTPRDLLADADLLLVAHQDSSTLSSFRLDPESGEAVRLGTAEVPTPVCLTPVPEHLEKSRTDN